MSKRQTVELITPSFDSKIRVVSYMEKYYLKMDTINSQRIKL